MNRSILVSWCCDATFPTDLCGHRHIVHFFFSSTFSYDNIVLLSVVLQLNSRKKELRREWMWNNSSRFNMFHVWMGKKNGIHFWCDCFRWQKKCNSSPQLIHCRCYNACIGGLMVDAFSFFTAILLPQIQTANTID